MFFSLGNLPKYVRESKHKGTVVKPPKPPILFRDDKLREDFSKPALKPVEMKKLAAELGFQQAARDEKKLRRKLQKKCA